MSLYLSESVVSGRPTQAGGGEGSEMTGCWGPGRGLDIPSRSTRYTPIYPEPVLNPEPWTLAERDRAAQSGRSEPPGEQLTN